MSADEFKQALTADVVIPVTGDSIYRLRQDIMRLLDERDKLKEQLAASFPRARVYAIIEAADTLDNGDFGAGLGIALERVTDGLHNLEKELA